jgi:diaminopimelate epimerase
MGPYFLTCHHINTGVPHAVIFVPVIQDSCWIAIAPKIRHHHFFQPFGVNVNFVQFDSHGHAHARTYERGVEAETAACGTGAAAIGLAIAKLYDKAPPIDIIPASGERLKITFTKSPYGFSHVELYGSAQFIFKGEFYMDLD